MLAYNHYLKSRVFSHKILVLVRGKSRLLGITGYLILAWALSLSKAK